MFGLRARKWPHCPPANCNSFRATMVRSWHLALANPHPVPLMSCVVLSCGVTVVVPWLFPCSGSLCRCPFCFRRPFLLQRPCIATGQSVVPWWCLVVLSCIVAVVVPCFFPCSGSLCRCRPFYCGARFFNNSPNWKKIFFATTQHSLNQAKRKRKRSVPMQIFKPELKLTWNVKYERHNKQKHSK